VEYFRNTVLDANDYFLGQVVQKQNIFGGDIGGPIGPAAKLGYFYFNIQAAPAERRLAGNVHHTSIPCFRRHAMRQLLNTFFTALTALV